MEGGLGRRNIDPRRQSEYEWRSLELPEPGAGIAHSEGRASGCVVSVGAGLVVLGVKVRARWDARGSPKGPVVMLESLEVWASR